MKFIFGDLLFFPEQGGKWANVKSESCSSDYSLRLSLDSEGESPIDSSPLSLYVLTEGVSCIPEEERSSVASSLPEVERRSVGGSKSSLLLVPP